jgi:hypothetical protein
MNIIKSLQDRIASRLTETVNPCKSYGSYATADAKGADVAAAMADYFQSTRPANYVVVSFEVGGKTRHTPCFDLTGLLARPETTGGYLGFAEGFYTY